MKLMLAISIIVFLGCDQPSVTTNNSVGDENNESSPERSTQSSESTDISSDDSSESATPGAPSWSSSSEPTSEESSSIEESTVSSAESSSSESGDADSSSSADDSSAIESSSLSSQSSSSRPESSSSIIITEITKGVPTFDQNIPSKVSIDGFKMMVQNQVAGELQTEYTYSIKSIGWSPSSVGENPTDGSVSEKYTQYITDIPLLDEMNVNTVRTYGTFEQNESGIAVLDSLYSRGIMVIMQVATTQWDFPEKGFLTAVNFFKNHPGILMWQVGNEFNYTKFYSDKSSNKLELWQAINYANTAIDDIHLADPNHPVSVGYGEGFAEAYDQIPNADAWALNIYRGDQMGAVFDSWKTFATKPLHIAEYGADAYNSNITQVDENAQAWADSMLTEIIMENYSATNSDGVCVGGSVFSFNDEWWKHGDDWNQTAEGFAFTVQPDGYGSEEYWGVVDTYRNPRKAYYTMQKLYQ